MRGYWEYPPNVLVLQTSSDRLAEPSWNAIAPFHQVAWTPASSESPMQHGAREEDAVLWHGRGAGNKNVPVNAPVEVE
jgi:hypothetical protein